MMEMARELGHGEDLPLQGSKVGFGLSWDAASGSQVDLDIQAIAFDRSGNLLQAVYYNNLKAFGRGLTHSSDEVTGLKAGIDEVVWADFARLPDSVALILYVVACYSGGHLRDARNGRCHVLLDSADREVATFPVEQSDEEVDLVAAIVRGDNGTGWTLKVVHEPAQDGRHFVDILEPTIGNFVRKLIPGAPKRIKAAFAMEKGALADLPKTDVVRSVKACLGWDTGKAEVDLDVSAILLGHGGSHVDTVFFGNLESQGVTHSGDNLTGEGGGDDEVITCDLQKISKAVQQIVFVINIYTNNRSFEDVANPYCRLVTAAGEEWCKFALREAGRERGLVMARLVREPGDDRFGFQAVGVPSRGSMWKDCMPDVMRIAGITPTQMQLSASASSVGAASASNAAAGYAPARVGAASASNGAAGYAPAGGGGGSGGARGPVALTVTIVGAGNLRAADWNGKSDPYCICEVPGQPSTKVQTQIIMRNLNPVWNETFAITAVRDTTAGPNAQTLRFTLMDYDMIGGHDHLGTAELSLGQLENGPFQGQLDVIHESKRCGTVRVAVSMGGQGSDTVVDATIVG